MTERNPPETAEEFTARVAVEIEALTTEILESGMSEDDARAKLSLMSEKHQFEQENHAVISTLEEYESIKAAMNYTPAVRNNAVAEVQTTEQVNEEAAEETPTLDAPVEGVANAPIVEAGHVSPQVAPVGAIEAVSAPAETHEAVPENKNEMLISRINMIDYVDRERQRAVRELEGRRRGDEVLPGLSKRADDLEAELKTLGTDERILNPEELKRKRSLESQLKRLVDGETEAKAYLNKADLEIGGNIEIVVSDFKNLDEELQQAIRVGDKAVLDKYNMNMWAAERIMRELSAREWQENQMKRKKAEGQTTWKDIAGAVGTPELALFSGDEIRAVLAERGIAEAAIGGSLVKLQEQLMQEDAPRQKVAIPKKIPSPDARVVGVDQGFGGVLDAKRNPTSTETEALEVGDGLKESIKNGTWEEVDQLISDPNEKISALAKEEWNRREQAALRYSIEKKTRGALENTLEAIESGHGDTVPKKWLTEFAEVPRVAKFLKEQKPVQIIEAPVLTEEVSQINLPDLIEPKTGYLDKLERNSARAQAELDALNVAPEALVNDQVEIEIPIAPPVVDELEVEPLIARNFNPEPPVTPELIPIDQTTESPEVPLEINESGPVQDPESQEADYKRFLAEYDGKEVMVMQDDGNVTAGWVVIGYSVNAYSPFAATLERVLGDGTRERMQASLSELDKWNAASVEEVSRPELDLDLSLDLELPLEDVLGEGEVKIEELPGAWNPEVELQNILKAPKAERKALLLAYRERLAAQKIGIGNAQKELIGQIKANPDVSKEDFLAQFTELTKAFHPTKEQFAIAEKAYDTYNKIHLAVEENFEKYNTPEALFTACFGMVPVGKVEVIKGPMTLYFRIHDDNDYAGVYKGVGKYAVSLEQKDIDDAKRSGGCAGVSTVIPELRGAVIAERAEGRPFEGGAIGIYEHEEQHAFNAVLLEGQLANFDRSMNEAVAKDAIQSAKEEFAIMNGGASAKEKEKASMMFEKEMERISMYASRVYRNERGDIADKRAADEILAYMKEGRDPKIIYEVLTRSKEDGGLYDYLKAKRSEPVQIGTAEGGATVADPEFIKRFMRTIEDAKSEVMGNEYNELLEEGIASFKSLTEHGLDKEAIISIFQHEPLTRWAKVAERLIEDSAPAPEPEVAEQFKEKFGIDEEMIKSIPGFRNLSPGQQLLALKNLESMALEDVKKDASQLQKEEWAKKSIWKRMGLSAITLGMSPDIRVAQIEKELAAKQRGGDANDPQRMKILAKNLAALGELTKVAKAGPEVETKANGELSIKYVSSKDVFGALDAKHLTGENLATMERFNVAADTYAKFPHEWGYETAKPGLLERFSQTRREYNGAKAEYEAARSSMLATYQAKFAEQGDKNPQQSTMLAMNKVDERMQLDQLFNTHPDAQDALLKVKDQSVIGAAAKEFWKKKGSFMVYGAAARAAAVAISGGIMLPVIAMVGGGVGYGIGNAEGKKLMKAKRADGRMSEEDVREEIEYAVFKKDENGKEVIDEKTGEKVIETVETRKIREFTDANFFVKRIDRLTNKLEQSTDNTERELLEKKIAQTVALMKEKNERGMINFGGSSLEEGDTRKGNTIANRLSFIQAMSKGEIETAVDKAALEAEMNRIVGNRQETIEDVRKSEVRKMAIKSGLIRGGFALAGGAIVGGVREFMHVGTPTGVPSATAAQEVTPAAPTAGVSQEAIDMTKHDGWFSELAKHAQQDPAFNKAYIDKLLPLLGRSPATSLSTTELNALQATDVPGREAAHQALLKAMEFAKGQLSDDEVAKIMLANNVPTSIQEAAVALGNEGAETEIESATAGHVVRAGDNLTKIIKEHIGIMKDLTPRQQDNAIQNLLSKLTQADMKEIGITDPNHITPGQSIQLGKLNDLLGSARLMNIKGESLINHAQHLGETSGGGAVAAEAAMSGHSPTSGFGEVREFVGTLSASDTASIESTLGRSISATESNVLHSIKGLSLLADTDAAKNNINEAVAHLGQEMRTTNGVPLTTEQMMHILHQHNALDAQIRIPEVAYAVSVPPEAMSSASKAAVVESAPSVVSPEASIQSAHSVAEIAAYIKHAPTPDESFTLTNLLELEQGTKMNPGLSTDIAAAKIEIINAMKLAKGELRPLAMYKILEAHHLESKVVVSPDAEGELLMYMETHKR